MVQAVHVYEYGQSENSSVAGVIWENCWYPGKRRPLRRLAICVEKNNVVKVR